jgi:uncharacterized repeat protein (TIGR01451 family)
MSRSSRLIRWISLIVLSMLPISHAIVVVAAPPTAPMLGFTPTATATTTTVTPTTVTPPPPPSPCDPVLTKRCEPAEVKPGDKVSFTIQVTNRGQEASVNAKVIDEVSEHFEIESVTTSQGIYRKEDQRVFVSPGIIGKDYTVTIIIHARVRESAPPRMLIENLVSFDADNCPYRQADCSWMLPESGGSSLWWTVAGGLGTVLLVLSLVLARGHRS